VSLSQVFAVVPLVPASAPPPSSARLLAQAFGAACSLRFSPRSYSGLVLLARFQSFHQPALVQAKAFAALAARLAGGVPVKLRRLSGYSGFVVSVPVAPWSPWSPPPVAQLAAQVGLPTPPPGGQCVATTRRGRQCSRIARKGQFCRQHHRLAQGVQHG
jgi:hypothetical protein